MSLKSILLFVLFFFIAFGISMTNKTIHMYGDALGYYIYLPAYNIHKNISEVDRLSTNENIDPAIRSGISNYKKSYSQNEEGYSIIQYTCGLAIIQSPAFLVVNIYDNLRGVAHTGFELRYQNAILFTNVFCLLVGLLFCYKSLRYFFPILVSFLSTAILLLGSNLFWFGFLQIGMAHVPQFMLIAMIIYLSIKNGREWKDRNVLLMSFLLGLITLIRPTDIIMALIPIVVLVRTSMNNQEYLSKVKKKLLTLTIPAILLFIIPIIPQLLYWKMMTGDFIFDSYDKYGFNWTEPQIIAGLFGAKNGWFTYTPLMLLASIPFLTKRVYRDIKWIFCLIVPIYIYITYAWFNYYYINGFGSRSMIHLYPIMIFGIAGLLSFAKVWQRILVGLLLVLSLLINLVFTHKQLNGRLYSDESTHAFNLATLLKKDLDYKDLFLLNSSIPQPDHNTKSNCSIVQSLELENSEIETISFDSIHSKSYLGSGNNYPYESVQHILTDSDLKDYSSICIGLEMRFDTHVFMPHEQHKLVVEIHSDGEQKYWESISINDKIGKKNMNPSNRQIRSTIINTWDRMEFHVPIEELQSGDRVKTYIWNTGRYNADLSALDIKLCN